MGKRTRENSISIKETFDNYVVIEWNNRRYAVFNLDQNFINMFKLTDYLCEIIHNDWNQAMINIENIRTGEIVLRQEVNSERFKNFDDWVEDVQ